MHFFYFLPAGLPAGVCVWQKMYAYKHMHLCCRHSAGSFFVYTLSYAYRFKFCICKHMHFVLFFCVCKHIHFVFFFVHINIHTSPAARMDCRPQGCQQKKYANKPAQNFLKSAHLNQPLHFLKIHT